MKKQFYILFFLASLSVIAQNTADYTVFSYNLNLANPAFVGKNEKIQLTTNYKKVWAGIENSLSTSVVSFSGPFNNGIGLGITILRDHFYLFNETIASVEASYSVQINDRNSFLFGIKAQGAFFNADLNTINTQTANDPLFTSTINNFRPNFSLGIALKNEKYFAHIALLDVLENSRFSGNSNLISNQSHLKINAGGGFYSSLSDNLKLTSTALIRIIEGTPLSFDLTSMLEINKQFDIGFTYRWNNAVMGNILIEATSWAQLGYSYGFSINDIAKYNNGTHEFFLRIYFNKQTKNNFKWKLNCF
ncbi:PorP/SprF family type IX secretion system membrane protein [Tenacibaculum sp. nBUS_03]|uniref:PorP/SprF family type IX secretion system membrane protein n=1 Tax=Tenacibaculum sp. nBUS_03 TaxID=3395320 RepID=UPI003EBF8D62